MAPAGPFLVEHRPQVALPKGFFQQKQRVANLLDVHLRTPFGEYASHILEILAAPSQDLRDNQIFRADERHSNAVQIDMHDPRKEQLFEAGTGKHHVERES